MAIADEIKRYQTLLEAKDLREVDTPDISESGDTSMGKVKLALVAARNANRAAEAAAEMGAFLEKMDQKIQQKKRWWNSSNTDFWDRRQGDPDDVAEWERLKAKEEKARTNWVRALARLVDGGYNPDGGGSPRVMNRLKRISEEVDQNQTLLEAKDPREVDTPDMFGEPNSPVPGEPMPAQNKQQLIHTLDLVISKIEEIMASPDAEFVTYARKKIANKLRKK